jgi:hypothetical protein
MLKEISQLAAKFENDVEKVKLELKRVASLKCRLKPQKAKAGYEKEMAEIVKYEQALKEARDMILPKKQTVTTMGPEDIALLNYDETVKAIKSIQSKKCLTQFATANIEDNIEYQAALVTEELLKAHKATLGPVESTVVQKSKINDMIKNLESLDDKTSKEYVIEQLKRLLGE